MTRRPDNMVIIAPGGVLEHQGTPGERYWETGYSTDRSSARLVCYLDLILAVRSVGCQLGWSTRGSLTHRAVEPQRQSHFLLRPCFHRRRLGYLPRNRQRAQCRPPHRSRPRQWAVRGQSREFQPERSASPKSSQAVEGNALKPGNNLVFMHQGTVPLIAMLLRSAVLCRATAPCDFVIAGTWYPPALKDILGTSMTPRAWRSANSGSGLRTSSPLGAVVEWATKTAAAAWIDLRKLGVPAPSLGIPDGPTYSKSQRLWHGPHIQDSISFREHSFRFELADVVYRCSRLMCSPLSLFCFSR
jgi:hypothetical protein